jgi:NAD(P)-dependent dehydrogenase (short-subunit alcohol dehydrogenase family)
MRRSDVAWHSSPERRRGAAATVRASPTKGRVFCPRRAADAVGPRAGTSSGAAARRPPRLRRQRDGRTRGGGGLRRPLGRLDVLCNVAGICASNHFHDLRTADWNKSSPST